MVDSAADPQFASFFQEHNEALLQTMFAISGKHAIHPQKADEWVQAQKTPLKRKVAQHLLENTTYVPFHTYFNGIGKLVRDHYPTITRGARTIRLFVSRPKKSYYFSAVIALHFIRKYGFREPDVFLHTIEASHFTDEPILIFDDMAYSGSQMSDWLTRMYKGSIPNYRSWVDQDVLLNAPKPNIHVLVYGVNSHSHRRLTQITNVYTTVRGKREMQTLPSPFPVYYVKKFPLLYEKDVSMYLLVNYFFSPYLKGNPPLAVYFDHKIADDVSTYANVFMHGPVIPASYAASAEALDRHVQEFTDLFGEFLSIDNRTTETLLGSELAGTTIQDLRTVLESHRDQDPEDPTDTRIQFAPFVEGCFPSGKPVRSFLGTAVDPDWAKQLEDMTYDEFLYPYEILLGTNTSDELTKKPAGLEEMVKRADILHDERYQCIRPFYKMYKNLRVPLSTPRRTRRRRSIGGTKTKRRTKTKTLSHRR